MLSLWVGLHLHPGSGSVLAAAAATVSSSTAETIISWPRHVWHHRDESSYCEKRRRTHFSADPSWLSPSAQGLFWKLMTVSPSDDLQVKVCLTAGAQRPDCRGCLSFRAGISSCFSYFINTEVFFKMILVPLVVFDPVHRCHPEPISPWLSFLSITLTGEQAQSS